MTKMGPGKERGDGAWLTLDIASPHCMPYRILVPLTPDQRLNTGHHSESIQLFATPWTAACQASLSITNSWILLKLTGESGLVSRGSQGLRSPLESRRGSLGAP